MHYTNIVQIPARVSAAAFSEYSIDLDLLSCVNTDDWNEFHAIQEVVMLRIMAIVKDAG